MTKDFQIEKKEFITEGRKIPLEEIRSKTLKEHAQYMRDHPDSYYENLTVQQLTDRLIELHEYHQDEKLTEKELRQKLRRMERTRHIIIWHDNSSVANHGYLLCLVAVLYDPAVYYTSDEYKTKTGKMVDIQSALEKPHLHFLARCRSSEDEQIANSETRLSCLQDTVNNLKSPAGNEIYDIPRLFKGDSPARQFEDGQQKGGNYFCNCGCHASMVDDLTHAQSCSLYSMQERVNIVMKPGTISKRNTIKGKTKPLACLSKNDLEKELAARGIYHGNSKQDLQKLLDEEMHGVHRLPALLLTNPQASLKDLNLDKYEILPVEPLHDIGHHIENVLTALPHHLSNKEKQAMLDSTSSSIGGKDNKRGCDYRKALIQTTAFLQRKALISEKPLQVLGTLTEMQRILYSPDEARCPQQILRYYNQAWLHAVVLKELISCNQMKKLTTRKMFGVYYHDLTSHGGMMLRIVSGKAANAEEEERQFNLIKTITKRTCNYSQAQIVPNVLLRLQVQNKMRENDSVQKQQSEIANLALALRPAKNTTIPLTMIKRYSREWQAHLMEISDYLVQGRGVWWTKHDDFIELFDISNQPTNTGPELHHFRSSNFSKEKTYLKECWEKCLHNPSLIPANVIRIDQMDGSTKKIHIANLGDEESAAATLTCRNSQGSSKTPQPTLKPINNTNTATFSLGNELDNLVQEEVIQISPAADETVDLNESENLQCSSSPSKEDNNNSSSQISGLEQITHTMPEQAPSQTTCSPMLTVHNYSLKTSHGKALKVVLGQTTEVENFDKQHFKLKSKQSTKITRQEENTYRCSVNNMKSKVSAMKCRLQELALWEKNYFVDHKLTAPTYDTMKADSQSSLILEKLKNADELLKQWCK